MITKAEKTQVFYNHVFTEKNSGFSMDLCIDINTEMKNRFMSCQYVSIAEAVFVIKKIEADIIEKRF